MADARSGREAGEAEAHVAALSVLPCGDGFAVALEAVETESGRARGSLAWLDRDGVPARPASSAPVSAAGTAGACGSLDLARLALADPAPAAAGRLDELRGALRGQALAVVAAGRTVVVLDGERDAPDGSGQRLLRTLLGPRGRAEPEALDLTPLRLSPGRTITGLALHAGWIHAFVADPLRGFDVLRASATAETPVFEPALTEGAQRFALNAMVSAAAAHPEGLLLGTAALAPAAEAVGSWGPELILLRPDGTWDLVWGQPRFTPDGLKRPLSDLRPGPDRPDHAAVKAIAPAGGRPGVDLCVLVQDFSGDRVEDRRDAPPDPFDYAGEARLWRSSGLEHWEPVPLDWPVRLGAATSMAVAAGGVLVGHEGLAGDPAPVTLLRAGRRDR